MASLLCCPRMSVLHCSRSTFSIPAPSSKHYPRSLDNVQKHYTPSLPGTQQAPHRQYPWSLAASNQMAMLQRLSTSLMHRESVDSKCKKCSRLPRLPSMRYMGQSRPHERSSRIHRHENPSPSAPWSISRATLATRLKHQFPATSPLS